MVERIPVQCRACGSAYAVRLVDGALVLPTEDGNCPCGCDEFERVESLPAEETAPTGDAGETSTVVCERCGDREMTSSHGSDPHCPTCGGTDFRPLDD